MTGPVIIGGIEFKSRSQLEKECGTRLKRPVIFDAFWCDLIAAHPRARDKLADLDPASEFKVRPNPIGTGMQTGFQTPTGEFQPIGWRTACEGLFSKRADKRRAELMETLRLAIRPQIAEFRSTLKTTNGLIECAAGTGLHPPQQIDIDHHPVEFVTIADEFIAVIPVDAKIEKHYAGHPRHQRFVDPALEEAWIIWHRERATYQPLSRSAHKSKRKTRR